MQFWQALFVGVFGYFAVNRTGWLGGHSMTAAVASPLVACTVFGFVFGNVSGGVAVGAAITAMYLGVIQPGGALPSDRGFATYIGGSLAIASGGGVEAAIALAVPLGLLGVMFFQAFMTFNATFPHLGDKLVEKGDTKGIARANIMAQVPTALFYIVFYTVANYAGVGFVQSILEIVPPVLMTALSITAKMLPAVGFAMLLKYTIPTGKEWLLSFFLMGFVLIKNTSMNIVSLLFFAIGISVLYTMARYGNQFSTVRGEDDDE